MNKILTVIVLLFLPFTGLQAQTEKGQAPEERPASAKALSETHHFLAGYEGTWTEEVTISTAEGTDPEKFTFTTVINMILGGRYLQCSQTGEMNGTAFEGLITLGYVESDGKFTLTQINTAGTGTLILEGYWKEPAKSVQLNDMHKPALKQEITFLDKDNFVIDVYEPKNKEFKRTQHQFSRQ